MSLAQKIIEALNKGLFTIYEKEKEEHPRILGKYHPSSIGECLRKQYYEFYEEERPSTEKLAIFATGRGIHEIIAHILENSDTVKVEAKEFETKLDFGEATLSGRVDIIVADLEGQKVIIEVKSTSQTVKEPYRRHVLQLQSYLHALNVEKGVILYWDKRKGVKTTFEVEKSPELLEKLKERTLILHEYIKNKKYPPKEAVIEKDYYQCIGCEYVKKCKPLQLSIENGSRLVIFEIDNVIFNTSKRMAKVLQDFNLGDNVNIRELNKETKEKIFQEYYSEKYIELDEPIHENIDKLIDLFNKNFQLVAITNRPPEMERCTIEQLTEIGIPYEAIFFRNSHYRGVNFKTLIIKLLVHSGYNIYDIFDEERTVKKIKEKLKKFYEVKEENEKQM